MGYNGRSKTTSPICNDGALASAIPGMEMTAVQVVASAAVVVVADTTVTVLLY